MSQETAIVVESRVVNCDGGGGPLGHPSVYLHIGEEGEVVCPYCSRRFVLSERAAESASHA